MATVILEAVRSRRTLDITYQQICQRHTIQISGGMNMG